MTAKIVVELRRLRSGRSKWVARIFNAAARRSHVVKFGARGYSDYTMHGSEARKSSYLKRHRARETWTLNGGGLYTAGFWSRWILWNKPTVRQSARDLQKRYTKLKIIVIE